MFSRPTSIIAVVWRVLAMPRSTDNPADRAAEPSRMEHLDAVFRAAGQTLGECPSWVLIAVERMERDSRPRPDREERILL